MIFISKFWQSLYYFVEIKQKLSITFQPQTNGQTKKPKSIMEVYFRIYINSNQKDWARLLLMAEFAYNNTKNISISYTLLEFNCGYYFYVFYKENIDSYSKSKSANKLLTQLQEFIIVCRKNLHHTQKLQK